MLNLKNVNKVVLNSRKQKINVLTNINIEIKQGDFVCVQGANGAGKSSLLSIVSASDMNFDGEYFVDGIELSRYTSKQILELKSSRFGVVPEQMVLIDKRTIEQNLELPLRFAKLQKSDRRSQIVNALNSVGLSENILDLKPTDLSIGQCQRVMIARAIVTNPQVIIADNPTSQMDEESAELILNLFVALNKSGVTIVVATRDENFLRRAKRVFTISRGMLVENMKVTRGKNIGEVIDIDAKKKKESRTSIKKQVIVLEKKETKNEQEPVSVVESAVEEDKVAEKETKPVTKTVAKSKKVADEVKVVKQESKEVEKTAENKSRADKNKDSAKKKKKTSPTVSRMPRRKNDSDDNQLTIESIMGNMDSKSAIQDEKPKAKKTQKAKSEHTNKSVKEVKTEEEVDAEALVKPVKSSRRKSK